MAPRPGLRGREGGRVNSLARMAAELTADPAKSSSPTPQVRTLPASKRIRAFLAQKVGMVPQSEIVAAFPDLTHAQILDALYRVGAIRETWWRAGN